MIHPELSPTKQPVIESARRHDSPWAITSQTTRHWISKTAWFALSYHQPNNPSLNQQDGMIRPELSPTKQPVIESARRHDSPWAITNQTTRHWISKTAWFVLSYHQPTNLSFTTTRWHSLTSTTTNQPTLQPGSVVCLLVGCLSSQEQASVSQGRICSDNFTCCHTDIEVAGQTFYLTQSQYNYWHQADQSQCSPPGRVATGVPVFESLVWLDPEKIPSQAGFEPWIFHSWGGRLNHQANVAVWHCGEHDGMSHP